MYKKYNDLSIKQFNLHLKDYEYNGCSCGHSCGYNLIIAYCSSLRLFKNTTDMRIIDLLVSKKTIEQTTRLNATALHNYLKDRTDVDNDVVVKLTNDNVRKTKDTFGNYPIDLYEGKNKYIYHLLTNV